MLVNGKFRVLESSWGGSESDDEPAPKRSKVQSSKAMETTVEFLRRADSAYSRFPRWVEFLAVSEKAHYHISSWRLYHSASFPKEKIISIEAERALRLVMACKDFDDTSEDEAALCSQARDVLERTWKTF